MTEPFGVYYLANDGVLDWLIASLESVRQQGYQGPITIIPYDEKTLKLSRLASRYNFSIMQDDSLVELDRIGLSLKPAHDYHAHRFRKFAAFWGNYDSFFFSDADVIALINYQEFIDAFRQSDLEFMYFSAPINHVYQLPLRTEMIQRYNSPLYNSGLLAGKRGALSISDIATYAEQAQPVRKWFALNTNDQPFVNYCTDLKQLRQAHVADLLPHISRSNGVKRSLQIKDNVVRLNEPSHPSHGKRLACLHWAGFSLNPWMPHRNIFLKYRLAPMSPAERLKHRFVWNVIFGPASALRTLASRLPGLRDLMAYLYQRSARTRKLRNMSVAIGDGLSVDKD